MLSHGHSDQIANSTWQPRNLKVIDPLELRDLARYKPNHAWVLVLLSYQNSLQPEILQADQGAFGLFIKQGYATVRSLAHLNTQLLSSVPRGSGCPSGHLQTSLHPNQI